jgi:hypothetical protein
MTPHLEEQNVQAGIVKFEGPGPFYLRAVERAKASVLAETIQLTLYAKIDDHGEKLVQIETQMTFCAAAELARHLLRAAKLHSGPLSAADTLIGG